MSYVKSLRRERSREGFNGRKVNRFADELEDDEFDPTITVRVTNRHRSSLDRKIRAAQSRDVESLVEAEWAD